MSTRVLRILFLALLGNAIKSEFIDDSSINPEFASTIETQPNISTDADIVHPNIIFILTDDWGINDVGWTHENTDTETPYLDNLAQTEGLILTNYYAERVCTASRAAFLTGRYPSNLGLQSGVCAPNQPAALTRQVSMLSNEFQSHGYTTHLIGKWHLGMMTYEYTPTYRGFDTFYGFWAGGEDYYSHKSWSFLRQVSSGDLFINEKPALYRYGAAYSKPYDNVFGTWWQKAEALNLLQSKVLFPDQTAPFFFYFAMQASHSPRQAPPEYTAMYEDGPNADNNNRVTFQAQTTTADDGIRDIVEYLKRSKLWDNTLVIIGSDNGAKRHYGDNAPYRGFKNTSWEGGVKVPGFVTGGYLPESQRGKILNYPMHIVDWYPTLLSAAGLEIKYERSRKLFESAENFDEILQIFKEDTRFDDTEDQELDGIDMWHYINGQEKDEEYFEEEREVLLDLKEVWCPFASCGALRIGKYKWIRGDNIASLLPDYDDGDKWFRGYVDNETKAESFCRRYEQEFEQQHNIPGFMINSVGCVNTAHGCLFDLDLDPCEYYDLSMIYPELVIKFEKRMNEHQDKAQVPLIGETNADELFKPEDITPSRVCSNPMFWCPFKKYKDVGFEEVLFPKKPLILEELETEEGGLTIAQWILYVVIPVCIGIVLIGLMVYCCYCRQKGKRALLKNHSSADSSDIFEDISEVQPLKREEMDDNVSIAKVLNKNKNRNTNHNQKSRDTNYGSTKVSV